MLRSAPPGARPTEPIDWLVVAPFVSATFLAKLSIPPLGARGLSLFFPVLIATMAMQLAAGRLTFVTGRLAWFAATAGSIAVIQLFAVQEFSAASLALFVLVGLALASRTTSSSGARLRAWFGSAATVIAAAGLAQFVLQFVVPLQFVYPVENLVPPNWRTQLFNNVATINWRVSVYRVNGVFMLEASEFSQLCAIALVSELTAVQPKTWRAVLFIAAILASYSGTGLMILAAALPVVVVRSGRWDLVARGLLLLIPLGLLAGPLHLDSTLARVNEFSGPGSSGYARFISWTEMFAPARWPDAATVFFGHGAGQTKGAGEMVYSKIPYEYGALAGAAYLSFAVWVLFSSACPLPLRVAVFLCAFLMNGAYSSWGVANVLTLLVWPAEEAAPSSLSARSAAALSMRAQVTLPT
ncbi:MAG TPA: hypothetical protein VLT58_01220 [Polyangia bacterium]|nr:hypothetical protein [Polyangia bacterium]